MPKATLILLSGHLTLNIKDRERPTNLCVSLSFNFRVQLFHNDQG